MGSTERIKQYLDYKGISKYAFYKKTGFSNKFLDNSSNMGTDRAEIILRHYPDISVLWLITGKGEMINSGDNNKSNVEHGTGTEKDLMYKELVTEKDKEIALLNREIGKLQLEIELIKQHHFTGYNEAAESSGKYNKKKP